jgi:NADH-quinone oxidoreductase subunit C
MSEVPEGNPPKPASEKVPVAPAPAAAAAPAPKPGPQPWQCEMVQQLKAVYGSAIREAATFAGQNYLIADRSICRQLLATLCAEHGYDRLTDLTAVHYPKDDLPIEMVWILYSMSGNVRVRVKVRFGDGEEVPTVTDHWVGANWMEREVYDMFGVRFAGHPDMRRILLPDEWTGYPLRKDYDLQKQDTDWVRKNLGIESGQ